MIEKFDDHLLEQDIAALSKEVQQHTGAVEAPREAIRSVIGEKLYAQGMEQPGSASAPVSAPINNSISPLPRYAVDESPIVKLEVETLIDEAIHKGIPHAIKEARKKDSSTMKLFHDSITEKLYAEFKRRGIIK